MSRFRFCPQCGTPLASQDREGVPRMVCGMNCGYVFWNNPTPVVAAVVQHGDDLILARNVAWPGKFFALVTGFLEASDPSPEEAVVREVEEELGLKGRTPTFIGHYRFERMNQIIIAYHVIAEGEIHLGAELAEYIRVPPAQATYWPAATGLALRDWLRGQGHDPQEIQLPGRR
ncbi:NUDIX domain-containing protein [Solimonas sp. K1W22B-7]|uniref:NUDIX domain-containing protein n=1 Tax=Solimonas sp. K1W22B-7 TaxID=2303331 RepID=UPI000E336709|nr:NUDIX domain-containing protein [Solimonas sp. K1W22B-7]AXQ31557.1 NUDIX domain-containing protein [Solimonas sp. K1W22B-7]